MLLQVISEFLLDVHIIYYDANRKWSLNDNWHN